VAALERIERHVEHGHVVGHEEGIELRPLQYLNGAFEVREVEIHVRPGAGIAPGAGVMLAGRMNAPRWSCRDEVMFVVMLREAVHVGGGQHCGQSSDAALRIAQGAKHLANVHSRLSRHHPLHAVHVQRLDPST
jgi:hypothetical protein